MPFRRSLRLPAGKLGVRLMRGLRIALHARGFVHGDTSTPPPYSDASPQPSARAGRASPGQLPDHAWRRASARAPVTRPTMRERSIAQSRSPRLPGDEARTLRPRIPALLRSDIAARRSGGTLPVSPVDAGAPSPDAAAFAARPTSLMSGCPRGLASRPARTPPRTEGFICRRRARAQRASCSRQSPGPRGRARRSRGPPP